MAIDRTTLLFFDASCLIAAAGSPTGGSAFLLAVCARGFLQAAVSQPVLLEAERNVRDNLSGEAASRYDRLVATTPLRLVGLPPPPQQTYAKLVGEKDAHVLAAALSSEAPFLITLDQGLERRVNGAQLALRALSPGDFIKNLLVQHRDYPSMREGPSR